MSSFFARTGIDRLYRPIPVAWGCHQFKNWWLRLFPAQQKMQTIPVRVTSVDLEAAGKRILRRAALAQDDGEKGITR